MFHSFLEFQKKGSILAFSLLNAIKGRNDFYTILLFYRGTKDGEVKNQRKMLSPTHLIVIS